MQSNLEKYKNDLDKLIDEGELLKKALITEQDAGKIHTTINKTKKNENQELNGINYSFKDNYQTWYSESLKVMEIILPKRLDNFKKLYEKDGVEKYLLNSFNLSWNNEIVNIFNQQLSILKSAKKRFESSLFDIQYLLQADLFDSELDAAKELNKNGFVRCGGAIAGVVLEKHLAQVCENHNIKIQKEKPTLKYYNETLKKNEIIDISTFRNIQYLADIRNKCDHNAGELSQEDVKEMIQGVDKIIKNVN